MRRRYVLLLISALVLALVAGACSSTPEAVPTPTAEPIAIEQEDDEAAPAMQEATPTQEPEPESDQVSEVVPTPKAGLVATDPTTVNLASGEPKLVEFFAFW